MTRLFLSVIALLFCCSGVAGCVGRLASHDIFVNQAHYWIGKSILALRRNSGPSRGVRQISNGHMEEEWAHGARCREFFEYDPATNIVVKWRFTGLPADCIGIL